jgi:hypothetical protein
MRKVGFELLMRLARVAARRRDSDKLKDFVLPVKQFQPNELPGEDHSTWW